jgi:hypothetical protein
MIPVATDTVSPLSLAVTLIKFFFPFMLTVFLWALVQLKSGFSGVMNPCRVARHVIFIHGVSLLQTLVSHFYRNEMQNACLTKRPCCRVKRPCTRPFTGK